MRAIALVEGINDLSVEFGVIIGIEDGRGRSLVLAPCRTPINAVEGEEEENAESFHVCFHIGFVLTVGLITWEGTMVISKRRDLLVALQSVP